MVCDVDCGVCLWFVWCTVGCGCGLCCVLWGVAVVCVVYCGVWLWFVLCTMGCGCGLCCVLWGVAVVCVVYYGVWLWFVLGTMGCGCGLCCVLYGLGSDTHDAVQSSDVSESAHLCLLQPQSRFTGHCWHGE